MALQKFRPMASGSPTSQMSPADTKLMSNLSECPESSVFRQPVEIIQYGARTEGNSSTPLPMDP